MSDFHKHTAWGRVRRPKNILGVDGTIVTSAAASDETIIDSSNPTNDLSGNITATSINTTTATITLTIGGGELDATAVGESVITRGFHPSVDGRLLPITAADDGANTISFKVPTDAVLSQNAINALSFNPQGTCTRQTLDGRKTENARFLHLYLEDSTNGGVTITVFGYNYAFGKWAVVQIPVGSVHDAATTAEIAYTDAVFTAASTARTHIIPIAGIDKVYFKSSAANDADVLVGAAISTF